MIGENEFLRGIDMLQLSFEREKIHKLKIYAELLEKWNKVYNLTGLKNKSQWWTHHFLDSLSIVEFVRGNSLVDIGTGAGLPGVVLAIAFPAKQITLVDSNQKKGVFLREVAATIGLDNIKVITKRVEHFHYSPGFSFIVSRAFSNLATFLRLASHLCVSDGIIVAMKGKLDKKEWASIPTECLLRVVRLDVPFLKENRNLVFMNPMRKEG